MASGMFKTVMDEAIKFQGWPYVWAGADADTGFDCSGLVMWSYRKANINLPRTAQEQYKATQRVEEKMCNRVIWYSLLELRTMPLFLTLGLLQEMAKCITVIAQELNMMI